VTTLSIAAGPIATAVICFLILIEEAGVPLPMFPGDGLLLTGGVMITAGQINPWVFLPCALAAGLAGAMIGYAWSRRVGQAGLTRLAERLRVRRHLDMASARLRRSGAPGVVVGRLLPGTRVYTTLVAGAIGMPAPTYARGLIASSTLWVGGFTGAGILVGYPAMAYLHRMEWVLLVLAALLAVLIATVVVLRGVRPPRWEPRPGPIIARATTAAAADLAIAAGLGLAGWSAAGVPPVWAAAAICVALLVTTLLPRLASRATIGERLAQASHRDSILQTHAAVARRLGRVRARPLSRV
jgi:membrane-associated protein